MKMTSVNTCHARPAIMMSGYGVSVCIGDGESEPTVANLRIFVVLGLDGSIASTSSLQYQREDIARDEELRITLWRNARIRRTESNDDPRKTQVYASSEESRRDCQADNLHEKRSLVNISCDSCCFRLGGGILG